MQKYSVNQHQIANILSWVRSGEIAIPEIQRPFVWDTTKIRDLIDSLYRGYPIGYIIVWQNPTIKLKNGGTAQGRKILIDGQQRVTALKAAIVGDPIVNKEYKQIRVRIAFNPQTEEFMTRTAVTANRPEWIEDIADIMADDGKFFDVIDAYMERNPQADKKVVQQAIQQLVSIKSKQLGIIELDSSLDIETVTEIFVRINSQGVVLSQADFVMSKIAAQGEYGENLRKLIDYFCHLSVAPHFLEHIQANDESFNKTDYLDKIAWLKSENDNLYDPSYNDVIRTVALTQFGRGKISDLVSLLSGRDFKTKEYREQIRDDSFQQMEHGVLDYVNETHFKRFLMIIKSAGYIDNDMISAQNALNFAYAVYLKLRQLKEDPAVIETSVRRWFVMSMLTGRHSGSFESTFEADMRRIETLGIKSHLLSIEEAELGPDFWDISLVQSLETSSARNPYTFAILAAQVHAADKGFLSTDISVRDMILHRGDMHHIFPKALLMRHGYDKSQYNQLANMVPAQTEINIAIGDKSPQEYLSTINQQIDNGSLKLGGITTRQDLHKNFAQNSIPDLIFKAELEDYQEFLSLRRKLLADKLKNYYQSL